MRDPESLPYQQSMRAGIKVRKMRLSRSGVRVWRVPNLREWKA